MLKAPLRWLRALNALARRWLVVIKRLLADPLAPISALSLILVISLFARVYDLSQPCTSPCQTPASHTLIFDESYYVNAARVIAGVAPPPGDTYGVGPLCSTVPIGTTCRAPFGDDPNAEHPQLAKLLIAGSIKLFGDNPKGWRLPSVLFSLIALAAIYGLVVALGGSGWLAAGATAVMALDNLMLVHGRIATLDIFGVAMMLIAAILYVRRWPLLAGVALGVGGLMKETSLYLVAVFVLYEAMRLLRAKWKDGSAKGWVQENLRPAFTVLVSGAASFLLGFWILDMLVPAYDTGTHILYAGSPFTHLFHIIHYAARAEGGAERDRHLLDSVGVAARRAHDQLRARRGQLDLGRQGRRQPRDGLLPGRDQPLHHLPRRARRCSPRSRNGGRRTTGSPSSAAPGCSPPTLISVYDAQIAGRVAYLYYMTVVMPGIYLIVVRFFARKEIPRSFVIGWSFMLVYGFLNLYPIQTLLPWGG